MKNLKRNLMAGIMSLSLLGGALAFVWPETSFAVENETMLNMHREMMERGMVDMMNGGGMRSMENMNMMKNMMNNNGWDRNGNDYRGRSYGDDDNYRNRDDYNRDERRRSTRTIRINDENGRLVRMVRVVSVFDDDGDLIRIRIGVEDRNGNVLRNLVIFDRR